MQRTKINYHRKSYFGKLFKIFLCIFAGLAIILAIFIGKNTFDTEKEKISTDVYCETKNFANWNDTRISTAESLLASMQTNDDVIRYAITGDYKYLVSIHNMINTYEVTINRLGINIGFIDEKRQKSIVAGGVNSLDLSKIKIPQNVDNTVYTLLEEKELPFYNNPAPAHIFLKQRMYAGDVTLEFFFVLYDNIPFNTFINENVCDYALVYNKKPILSSGDDFENESYFSKLGGFMVNSKLIYHKQSDTDGLFSYVCRSKNIVSAKGLFNGICWLLILLISAVLISFMLAKYLSYPVLKIMKKLQYEDMIDNSDFDSVFKAIDKIILNSEKLNEKNTLNEKIAVQRVLFDICNGNISDHQIGFYINEYNLSILKRSCTVSMLRIENQESIGERFGIECVSYLKRDIVEILQVLFPSLLYFNNNLETAIIIIEGKLDNSKKDSIQNTLERIWEQFEIQASLQIGGVSNNYRQMKDCYMNLLVAKKSNSSSDKNKYIYDITETQKENSEDIYYTLDMERQLISYLVSGKEELAKKLIENIIDYNMKNNYTDDILDQLQGCFVVTISRTLSNLGKTKSDVYGDINISEFDKSGVDNYKEYIWTIFKPIFDFTRDNSVENTSPIHQKIERFILEHLKDDVSLDDLSDYLKYSSGYTSKLFKTIFGTNFKTYVNQCRVEESKKLLRNGYKVIDVAKKVGCTHSETFIRIFKKSTGISPGEYVKQLENYDGE